MFELLSQRHLSSLVYVSFAIDRVKKNRLKEQKHTRMKFQKMHYHHAVLCCMPLTNKPSVCYLEDSEFVSLSNAC